MSDARMPVALVTGAGRGIGRGVAAELASRGWRVFAGVRRDPDQEPPEGVELVRLDVTDPDPAALPDPLDLLVNNAGLDPQNLPLESTPSAEWQRVLGTNVVGLAEVTRLAISSLRNGTDPVIANVTTAGLGVPMPFFGLYRASKAAVSALGESLAVELAPIGIRVIEVMPGPVLTDMLAGSVTPPDAIGEPGYRELADLVAELRPATDEQAVPVEAAAARFVDAIESARSAPPGAVPLRQFCDDVGAEVVGAWQHTSDEEHIAMFRSVFTPR